MKTIIFSVMPHALALSSSNFLAFSKSVATEGVCDEVEVLLINVVLRHSSCSIGYRDFRWCIKPVVERFFGTAPPLEIFAEQMVSSSKTLKYFHTADMVNL